jgi:transmembrane protein 216
MRTSLSNRILLLYVIVDWMRIYLSSKGNKTEQINSLATGLGLGFPIIVVYAYFMALQTYVLRVEVIINAIGLVFVCLEILAGAMTILNIYSKY